MFTELSRTEVGLPDFASGKAFHGKQRSSQGDQHVYFALETLRGLGERLEQREPLPEMSNGFHMGGALAGSLTSRVPIADCLLGETCLSIVMCQRFRLTFNRLRK